MRKKNIIVLVMIFVLALLLVACSSDGGTEDASSEGVNESEGGDDSGNTGEPRSGGNLVVGQTGEPDTLNPLYSTSAASIDGFRHILNTLVIFNEKGEAVPELAESWELSDDGLKLTFKLRDDVTWHDGEPFTAEDVAFTFDIAKHEDYTGQRASISKNFIEINAIDDYTVEFIMDEPNYMILRRVNPYYILPKHVLEDIPIAELGEADFNRNPIGTGPFKFDEWKSGQYLNLVANEDYWKGAPYLDSLTLKFVPDSNSLMAQFKGGDVDYISVEADDLPAAYQLVEEGVAKLHEQPGMSYRWIAYNTRKPLLNKTVRQALTSAIDRQSIVDNILDGNGGVLYQPALPFQWSYNDNAPKFEYDPERARELLAEAGWSELNNDGYLVKDGEVFEFEVLISQGNKTYEKVGEVVQQMWKEVGVKANLKVLELSALQEAAGYPDFEFDAYIMGLSVSLDPSKTSLFHSDAIEKGLNRVGFSNARVDELTVESDGLIDQDARKELLDEVIEIVSEEQPYTFLFHPTNQTLYTSKLQDVEFAVGSSFKNIQNWWLEE